MEEGGGVVRRSGLADFMLSLNSSGGRVGRMEPRILRIIILWWGGAVLRSE